MLFIFFLEENKYRAGECSEEIEGLQEMIKILNDTNDLSGFTVTLRKKFISLKS